VKSSGGPTLLYDDSYRVAARARRHGHPTIALAGPTLASIGRPDECFQRNPSADALEWAAGFRVATKGAAIPFRGCLLSFDRSGSQAPCILSVPVDADPA
jgi:hypothetical protein